MKRIHKILSVFLICMALFSGNVYASTLGSSYYTYRVTMYAPDGRTISVDSSAVPAWKNVGWFEYPVVAMYAPDGRSIIVASTDVYTWENVGWIDGRRTTTIYAADGRSATVPLWQLQQYLNVGWYETPVLSTNSFYYPGTSLPKYDSVVWGTFISRNGDYTSDGAYFETYGYVSDLTNKQRYVDYLEQNGWEYFDADVEDEASFWTLTKGNTMVTIGYFYSHDRVWVTFGDMH
ncbi:MAG: hypothetical protein E7390_01895 [Ruminococcaceae bacterium]|nr:hypothetical protein [Oscillospiraceae bacterium]